MSILFEVCFWKIWEVIDAVPETPPYQPQLRQPSQYLTSLVSINTLHIFNSMMTSCIYVSSRRAVEVT